MLCTVTVTVTVTAGRAGKLLRHGWRHHVRSRQQATLPNISTSSHTPDAATPASPLATMPPKFVDNLLRQRKPGWCTGDDTTWMLLQVVIQRTEARAWQNTLNVLFDFLLPPPMHPSPSSAPHPSACPAGPGTCHCRTPDTGRHTTCGMRSETAQHSTHHNTAHDFQAAEGPAHSPCYVSHHTETVIIM